MIRMKLFVGKLVFLSIFAGHTGSFHSSHAAFRLLGLRYVFLYTIVDDSFSTLLAFEVTLVTLHRLDHVVGVLPVDNCHESSKLREK
jgi:hypothetical protein